MAPEARVADSSDAVAEHPCPVCGTSGRGLEGKGTRWGVTIQYRLFQCDECDVQFYEPPTIPDGYYERLHAASVLPWGYRIPWNHRQFLRRDHPSGALLDVGCGSGAFLDACRRRGFRTKGVEVNPMCVRQAVETYGLDVTTETLADLADAKQSFDYVTFFEVLNMLPEPRRFLRDVHRLARPTTRVALSVPNRERTRVFQDPWDLPPLQMTRWTTASLRRIFLETGFDVQDCVVQRPGLRLLVGHLYHPIRHRLRNRYVALAAAGLLGLLLYVPFRLFGKGKYIYCEASPRRAAAAT